MGLTVPPVAQYLRSKQRYPLAKRYGIRSEKVVNLASNENPYGPSPKVKQALRREISRINAYPDPASAGVKRAISKYLKVGRSSICVANGSDELMDLVCKAFLDRGEVVFIPIPTFALYRITAQLYGGKVEEVRLPGFEWDSNYLIKKARGAKIAFIGRPNNPTGNGPDLNFLKKLAEEVKLVVVDEAYAEFSSSSSIPLIRKTKNLLVLRTLSKAFGLAGLRIGYGVGSPEVVQVLDEIRAPFNVNRLAQVAAEAALSDLEYMRRVAGKIVAQRERLRRDLVGLGFEVLPSESNFLMVGLEKLGLTAPRLCELLARKNIFIRDLSGFRGAGENYVRISVGKPDQNTKLVKELRRIGEKYGRC